MVNILLLIKLNSLLKVLINKSSQLRDLIVYHPNWYSPTTTTKPEYKMKSVPGDHLQCGLVCQDVCIESFSPRLCLLLAATTLADSVGNRTVLVSTINRNWFVAREVCQSYGKVLLEIHSPKENAEAQAILEKHKLKEAWIGANDLAMDDDFKWTSGQRILNEFWAPGSYDDKGGSQDCVSIVNQQDHSHNWFDRECDNKYPFICQ